MHAVRSALPGEAQSHLGIPVQQELLVLFFFSAEPIDDGSELIVARGAHQLGVHFLGGPFRLDSCLEQIEQALLPLIQMGFQSTHTFVGLLYIGRCVSIP